MGLSFCHLFVSLWRILPVSLPSASSSLQGIAKASFVSALASSVGSVTMPASLLQKTATLLSEINRKYGKANL